ncbi:transmembrane protein 179 [Lepisosteus oculatus]|uniref:transmembrane protein 179 n=1 Tax=Lepisosteus oculatus TaxID=7918 RepID=UPI0035F5196B
MAPQRRLLLAHGAAYALSVLGGLLTVVPLALNGSHFKGRCLLFSRGHWRPEGGLGAPRLQVLEWGPPAACQLPAFVGVFTVLFGAVQSWRSIFYLHRGHDDTPLCSALTLLLSASLLLLSLGSSVTLSLGFQSWCDTVTGQQAAPFSCAEAQATPLYLDVDTTAFYSELTWAQAGLWGVSVLWLALSVLSFLRLYCSHRREVLGPCLAREKELLLGLGCDPQPMTSHPCTHEHPAGHFI